MKNGNIIEKGSTYNVFHKTKENYTKELISSIPTLN